MEAVDADRTSCMVDCLAGRHNHLSNLVWPFATPLNGSRIADAAIATESDPGRHLIWLEGSGDITHSNGAESQQILDGYSLVE